MKKRKEFRARPELGRVKKRTQRKGVPAPKVLKIDTGKMEAKTKKMHKIAPNSRGKKKRKTTGGPLF